MPVMAEFLQRQWLGTVVREWAKAAVVALSGFVVLRLIQVW